MKWLTYNLINKINTGTMEEPVWVEEKGAAVQMGWNEANEKVAYSEAWQGKVEIIDDGEPDPALIPTQLDTIEAQVTYTAMMTDTLLEV